VELAAYLDESGKHDGSKILTVSGYLSYADQWIEFRREWTECLLSQGITSFHMTDFDSSYDQFQGWSLQKKVDLQLQLIGLIHKRLAYGICVAVNLADLEDVLPSPKRNDLLVAAYSLAFIGYTKNAHFWSTENGLNQPIAYFVESGSGLGRIIPRVWNLFTTKQREELLLGQLTWVEKKNQLHQSNCESADMLAYEGQKRFSGRIRKSFGELVRPTDFGCCLEKSDLQHILQDFCPPEQREAYLKQFENERLDKS
jgi:hypothetical protein